MRARVFQVSSVVVGLLFVAVLLTRAGAQAPGQERAPAGAGTAANAGPAPKTPWGAPDLQGIWTQNGMTPLQRPPKYANKEFFTDEERAEIDRERQAIVNKDLRRE